MPPAAADRAHICMENKMIQHFNMRAAACLIAFSLSSFAVYAHDYQAGDLMINHPWTRATPKGAAVAGGYAKITNHGADADRLVGGSVDGADKIEIHEMSVENNIMKMRQLEAGLEIKAGETVELKPGSFHLMMMGLKEPYKEGEKIKGTLIFEKAGTVEVEFKVEAMGASKDHGNDNGHAGHGEKSEHKGH